MVRHYRNMFVAFLIWLTAMLTFGAEQSGQSKGAIE
jgi:hypothetical protein